MIGICIQAAVTCPSCENKVPVNAMVPSIRCPGCQEDLKLTIKNWKSILDNALKEAPSYNEGEGSNLSVFGDYRLVVTYGKLSPRYDGTKQTIDMETLLASIDKGVVLHPETKTPTNVRRIPEHFAEEFKGVVALVAEDSSLLPGTKAGKSIEKGTSGPVAFQCPGCGGSLILDGEKRTVVCSFCDNQVYLPDDLWLTLHPVETKKRWFLLFDEMQRPVEWDRYVYDVVRDDEGNFYFALEAGFNDQIRLVSTKPDRLLRWKRDDLNLIPRTTRGETKIAITHDGRLLVTCADRPRLFIISTEDGSTIDTIDEPEVMEEPRYRYFSMKDSLDFGVFPDNTLLLYRICNRKDDRGAFYDLQRFDLAGNLLQLWDPDAEKLSFFEKVRKFFSSKSIPYSITDTKGYPTGARDTDIRLTVGHDGSVYMLEFKNLLKFAPSGRKIYVIELPCHYTTGRAAVNDQGEAFVLGNREGDRNEIFCVSPDGTRTSVAVKSSEDGGPLEKSGLLTLSPGGGFNVIGYSGYWMDFSAGEISASDLFSDSQ